jgi:hypothetical protein
MTDADTEQEPAGIRVLDTVIRLGDLFGRRRPDVDDPGGDLKRLGLFQDRLDKLEVTGRRTADPHGAIAKLLDLDGLLGFDRAERPDAVTAHVRF